MTKCSFARHDSGRESLCSVCGKGLGLELVVDGARLVAHVARVVAEPGDRDLRDQDLLDVVSGEHHAAATVEHVRDGRPLGDLVEHRGVTARECEMLLLGKG